MWMWGLQKRLFLKCLATTKKQNKTTMSVRLYCPLSILVNGVNIVFNPFGSSQSADCDTTGLFSLPDSSLSLSYFRI